MIKPDGEDKGEGDDANGERMLFGERRKKTTLLAGSGLGVTRIDVAAAQVGQFSLLDRATVTGLATDRQTLIVATDETVAHRTDSGLDGLGFGPAKAVGIDDTWVYAAGTERVARLDRSELADATAEDWETVGNVAEPRRFVGALLAAEKLVRVGSNLDSLGLDNVRDLSANGKLAATGDGLYERYEDGWTQLLDGDTTAVAGTADRAHAVVDGTLLKRDGADWTERSVPNGAESQLLAYGQTLAVIDTDGTVHIAADPELTHDGHGGWRSQAIGLDDVTALVAVQ